MSAVVDPESPPSGPSSLQGPTSASGSNLYAPGNVIAERYELVRQLGQGGVGQVWLAKSQTLHNEVALKLFLRGGPGDGAERLLGEARAAAALEHPAIVRVFDYGETERGDPFLVMEHLKGESLDELLARVGPLLPSRALGLLLPLLAALSVAHGKRIVHRDIKPANLFLAVDEAQQVQPKLIDFGLARLQRGGMRLTQEGMLVGSPAYMSPEQIRDVDVDARTDLWSLTVVLHELITGHMPFTGETQFDMFKSIVEGEPTALPLGGEVDAELIAILHRGLAKNPADRFPSARDLGVAFARWLVAHGHEDDICGASLRNEWLRPRKISSLAPPTPAVAFFPPGLAVPIVASPPAPSAAYAATQEAIPAPDLATTADVPRPKRRWLGALFLIALACAGYLAWTTLRAGDDAPAPGPSAQTSAPTESASTKRAPAPSATVKVPSATAKPTTTASAKSVKPAPSLSAGRAPIPSAKH